MPLKDIFNDYILGQRLCNGLVVQPRMGFSDRQKMRDGLLAVKATQLPVVGTLTLDAMTRQGLTEKAKDAVERGDRLNGYPLASYSEAENRELLAGIQDESFPVQVRHGTPIPKHVFQATMAAGLYAIEGGPVSYALPYGRALLENTFPAWRESLRIWSKYGEAQGIATHMESFAGCMMGQLCPPSLLIALGILEGLFIREQGVCSLSLSLAQGTNSDQDIAALLALNKLMEGYFADVSTHIVAYTWMGVFPDTATGAENIIRESARVATVGGAHRLIVKTINEAIGIPSVENNLQALAWCSEVSKQSLHKTPTPKQWILMENIYTEARQIIESVRCLDDDIETAIQQGFKKGLLDIPFCLHPDNPNQARAEVATDGMINWADPGRINVINFQQKVTNNFSVKQRLSSQQLIQALEYNRWKYR